MDVVATMIGMMRFASKIELVPIVFQPGCQRVLFRAETTAAAYAVTAAGAFCFDGAGPNGHSSVTVMSFVTTIEEAISCAQRVNNGRHFFICDLPDQFVEMNLEVRDPEQHIQTTQVDTLFRVYGTSSESAQFVKAGPLGTQWQPRLLLLAKVKEPNTLRLESEAQP